MTHIHDKNYPGLQYLIADNIHSPDVAAIFSTRNGGVSGQTFETEHLRSLNLGFNSEGETYEHTAENYKIVASSQGFSVADVIGLQQRHTDIVIAIDEEKLLEDTVFYRINEEADALVTNVKGVLLSISIADCVPILLYDDKHKAIGAAHAGWRGTFSQIGAKTVRKMVELYGADPADIQVAIGPAVGLCCYEVGYDFYYQFIEAYGEKIDAFFSAQLGKVPHCDLKAMNKSFLMEAGVPSSNIEVSELCTRCNPELFYSHRRSGNKRGSMAAFIGMRK